METTNEPEQTYSVTFYISGIPESGYEEIVKEIEMDIRCQGYEVCVGVGEPDFI